jgi:hypothetical protein
MDEPHPKMPHTTASKLDTFRNGLLDLLREANEAKRIATRIGEEEDIHRDMGHVPGLIADAADALDQAHGEVERLLGAIGTPFETGMVRGYYYEHPMRNEAGPSSGDWVVMVHSKQNDQDFRFTIHTTGGEKRIDFVVVDEVTTMDGDELDPRSFGARTGPAWHNTFRVLADSEGGFEMSDADKSVSDLLVEDPSER